MIVKSERKREAWDMKKTIKKQINRKGIRPIVKKGPRKTLPKGWHQDAVIHQNILFDPQFAGF